MPLLGGTARLSPGAHACISATTLNLSSDSAFGYPGGLGRALEGALAAGVFLEGVVLARFAEADLTGVSDSPWYCCRVELFFQSGVTIKYC